MAGDDSMKKLKLKKKKCNPWKKSVGWGESNMWVEK